MRNSLGRLIVCVALLGFALPTSAESGKSFIERTDVSGSVDVGYSFNFNRPPRVDTNGNGFGDTSTNMIRGFDTDANSFSLHFAEIAVEHSLNDWAKFRLDLDFGRDPRVFQAFGFNDGDNFEIEQGYVQLTAPVGNGLVFKIGKFATLHGAEVIESASNLNYSRSLLFTWAIPFTHTGVLMDYAFADWLDVMLGVVNGWDNVLDNNNAKTLHGMATIKPSDKLSLVVGGSFGSERDDSDANFRGLIDAVATWNALENLTFTANFDLGKERGIGGTGFANWWGGAGYVHWRASDLFGLSARGEFFAEDTPAGVGVRTGTAASKIGEGTLTAHFYLTEGLDLRAEYRRDMAANAIFVKSNGSLVKNQDTLGLEAVYAF